MEILSAVASRGYDLSVVDISHHPRESLAHVLFQKGAAGAVLMGGNFPADAGLEEIGISVTRDEHHEAQFLSLTPRPTAIVGLCDTYAENTLIAAREAGLSVPDDLSVTGFDDVDQTLVRAVSLTTVRVDLGGVARTAIDSLLNQDQTAEKQTEFRVGTELILRGSTAPPPADTGASI